VSAAEYWVVKRGPLYLTNGHVMSAFRKEACRFDTLIGAWGALVTRGTWDGNSASRVVRVRVKKIRRPIEVGDCVRTSDGELRLVSRVEPGQVWFGYGIVYDVAGLTLVARGKRGGK